jgi:GTP cyclohydrolase I
MEHTGAKGAAVLIEARHMCMSMRGVAKAHSSTLTECYRGVYERNLDARNALLQVLMHPDKMKTMAQDECCRHEH